ncbi:hypothetical protein ENBRE01_0496 [Enteropsectra breve]|nr:hypothetical protein ENBRE01_0496 [Enteropsectra breve]
MKYGSLIALSIGLGLEARKAAKMTNMLSGSPDHDESKNSMLTSALTKSEKESNLAENQNNSSSGSDDDDSDQTQTTIRTTNVKACVECVDNMIVGDNKQTQQENDNPCGVQTKEECDKLCAKKTTQQVCAPCKCAPDDKAKTYVPDTKSQ